MKFTLVSTTFNELSRLQHSIDDIEKQTLLPAEIIVIDAGSSDGTYQELLRWSKQSEIEINILKEEGCNVARGRNLAIKHASNEIIVSTDFGCRYHSDWLLHLMEPFQDPQVSIVGGGYAVIEKDIQSGAAKANYLLTHGYAIDMDTHFIPSSRSIAYKKEVWKEVGGYDEWLTLAADDLVFGLKVKAKNIPIHFVQRNDVFWGRHLSFSAYVKEAERYGLGDGEAGVNDRNALIMSVETGMRYLFVANLVLATLLSLPWYGYLPMLILVAGFRPYKRLLSYWLRVRSVKYDLRSFLSAVYLMERQRISYLTGYIKGFFFSDAEVKQQQHKLKLLLK